MTKNRNKRVLIHSLIYSPDGVSTAYLYRDIALALKQAGMEVSVLTTTPHYNAVKEELEKQPIKWKVFPLLKKSEHDGIKVTHIPMKKFKSTILRLLSFIHWHIISFSTALFMKKPDIIISPSPPLTIGMLNVWLGKLKGAKVVYNVQEVYPDILGLKEGRVFDILSKMERFVYDKSSAVTTIDDVFYNNISGRFKDPSKLKIIPNFVDTELYRPLNSSEHPNLDRHLFVRNDHLKLLYAGNVGMAQDWDTLIELARKTKDLKIDFYVIGEGVKLDYLKERVAHYNLEKVRILPYQPRNLMPEIIAFSDIQFIFMEPQIAAQGFPSKVYTIMACGKPLLVCSPEDSPIVKFLRPIGCAKLVTETEMDAKTEDMKRWLNEILEPQNLLPDGGNIILREMGEKGLKEIEGNYSKDVVTRKYADLLSHL